MKELTIIIPITELNDSTKYQNFKTALESAKYNDGPIIVVGDAAAIKSASIDDSNINILENTSGNISYAAQVNFAVNNVKTKYFSVLEYDDTFREQWFKNLSANAEQDTEDTFAFLPLTEVIDNSTKQIISYANEAFWASSFSEEIGVADINCMEDYLNFNTSGAVFKTEEFISLGGLKESMKLVFWYEFLLRALYKGKRVYVIPKVGYIHTANVEGSMTDEYGKTMGEKEISWWLDLAKKEYFFPQDRKKVYEEE